MRRKFFLTGAAMAVLGLSACTGPNPIVEIYKETHPQRVTATPLPDYSNTPLSMGQFMTYISMPYPNFRTINKDTDALRELIYRIANKSENNIPMNCNCSIRIYTRSDSDADIINGWLKEDGYNLRTTVVPSNDGSGRFEVRPNVDGAMYDGKTHASLGVFVEWNIPKNNLTAPKSMENIATYTRLNKITGLMIYGVAPYFQVPTSSSWDSGQAYSAPWLAIGNGKAWRKGQSYLFDQFSMLYDTLGKPRRLKLGVVAARTEQDATAIYSIARNVGLSLDESMSSHNIDPTVKNVEFTLNF